MNTHLLHHYYTTGGSRLLNPGGAGLAGIDFSFFRENIHDSSTFLEILHENNSESRGASIEPPDCVGV